jgi:plasmid stabilization system protein ParE
MQIVVHPVARQELDAALEWSKEVFGERTASRFRSRFDQLGQMLLRQPAIGTLGTGRTRKLRLGKFPYSLVYRVQGEVITVIAVAHQSRKPGYWRGR